MQKGLLIIAHGSPRQEANEEFLSFVTDVQKRNPAYLTQAAFLGSSKPTISESVKWILDQGVTKLQVIPYFLNNGNHVAIDIPEIIAKEQEKYPGVTITLKPYIGSSPEMINLILKML